MSRKKAYMSIDAHARHCVLGWMDARGEFRQSWTFPTTEEQLVSHVKGVDAGTKIVAIEEGSLTGWIARTIRPHATEVVIADPRENHLISRNAMKGDKVDVRQLCRLLRLGELKHVYHPRDDDRAVFKAAVKQYIDFRDQETQLKRKIKAKYRSWGVQCIDGVRVYHPGKRAEFLAQLGDRAVRHQLERLYSVLDATLDMQASARKEAMQLSRRYPEIEQFMRVPGVGPIGAMIFDAYIQTPHRFPRKSALWRYCRLGVSDRTSDGKPLGYKRLDKAGNSELKAMSYRAFLSAMRIGRDNEVRRFFDRSLAGTRNPTNARLNTQRKIISVLHGIWRKEAQYDPKLFLGSEHITLTEQCRTA